MEKSSLVKRSLKNPVQSSQTENHVFADSDVNLSCSLASKSKFVFPTQDQVQDYSQSIMNSSIALNNSVVALALQKPSEVQFASTETKSGFLPNHEPDRRIDGGSFETQKGKLGMSYPERKAHSIQFEESSKSLPQQADKKDLALTQLEELEKLALQDKNTISHGNRYHSEGPPFHHSSQE